MSARVPERFKPWEQLGKVDRAFLDAVADGMWVDERSLRARLRWGRIRFGLVTAKLVLTGWIASRPVGSGWYGPSEYRLSARAW